MRQFQHYAGRILAQLRSIRRKPAVNGIIHQQDAEQEHEYRGGERNQGRAHHHAGAQPCTQGARALAGIELENVSEQQHHQHHEQQEDQHRDCCKYQRPPGCFRVEKAYIRGVKCIERAQRSEEHEHPARKQGDRPAPGIAEERHAAIIERTEDRGQGQGARG